jgi:hypothetical protein
MLLYAIEISAQRTKYSYLFILRHKDRLCGLVVRVLGYRSGGPGSIPRHYQKKK